MEQNGLERENEPNGLDEKPDRNYIPWIAAIVAFMGMGIITTHDFNEVKHVSKQNKTAIADLKRTKANVHQLQTSNCTLRIFLATARLARHEASKTETGNKKAIDKSAVAAYTKLIIALDGESYCPIPQKLLIPNPKLTDK